MKSLLKYLTLPCLAILAFATAVSAAQGTLTPGEKDKFAENLLLPSPSEIFVALDKMGETKWNDTASFSNKYDYDNDYLRALNLGVRSADGFLAIQAKDKEKLGDMIVVILTLAEELLVKEAILRKGDTFKDLSKRGEWDKLHRELDSLREDVVQEMNRMGDKDIALLVSAGGWLEGLRATTKILKQKYSERASSILYQPRLVQYFSDRLAKIEPKAQDTPAVKLLMDKLPEIDKLVNVGYKQPIPPENVNKLYEISSELIETIEKG